MAYFLWKSLYLLLIYWILFSLLPWDRILSFLRFILCCKWQGFKLFDFNWCLFLWKAAKKAAGSNYLCIYFIVSAHIPSNSLPAANKHFIFASLHNDTLVTVLLLPFHRCVYLFLQKRIFYMLLEEFWIKVAITLIFQIECKEIYF